ncbi:hypothetical protein E2C01_072808 [Portunus trituberculatus]|uniref:Uncharacterized protein n=1 Tax=Portunus trituberculatus TaxID=210409 RepID=A0A5B7ICE4_PORTR|nr:hypothetical protein [Portunus trituberculatus]
MDESMHDRDRLHICYISAARIKEKYLPHHKSHEERDRHENNEQQVPLVVAEGSCELQNVVYIHGTVEFGDRGRGDGCGGHIGGDAAYVCEYVRVVASQKERGCES